MVSTGPGKLEGRDDILFSDVLSYTHWLPRNSIPSRFSDPMW